MVTHLRLHGRGRACEVELTGARWAWPDRPGQLAVARQRRGSGYEQAKAELRRVKIDDVAIAFGPPAGREIRTEDTHGPLLGVRPHPGPHRYSAPDMIVQIRLGPAPVGLEEAVRAVPRNEHRLHPGSGHTGHLGHRRPADEKASDLRQVVAGKPEPAKPPGVAGVVREYDHAAGNAPHLAQPGDRVRPVMNGGNGHRGVE